MKKLAHYLFLITCCLITTRVFAQELRYADIKQATGDIYYTSYVAKDGTKYKLGDNLRLKKIEGTNVYRGITQSGDRFFYAGYYVYVDASTGLELKIQKITKVDGAKGLGAGDLDILHLPYAVVFLAQGIIKNKTKSFRVYIDVASDNHEIERIEDASPVTVFKPTAPPVCEVKSVTFSDKKGNSNNILDANEKASITFTLFNTGKGEAYGLVADVKLLNSIKGIEYANQHNIGNLAAGGNVVVNIPVSAKMSAESGTADFEILIKEGNGFDADPVRISYKVQKFKNPQLVIVDHKFSTAHGGKVKTGQPVSMELILQNRGQGVASNVKVVFNNPTNVFPGSETQFTIDKLGPNETRILTYEFFTNKLYTAKEIPIEAVVTESYNNYGEKRTLSVSLEQTLSKTQTVTVAGEVGMDVKIDNVLLQSAVSSNLNLPETKAEIESIINSSGKPVFYSLIIGVEKYRYAAAGLTNLNKPVSDAKALRSALLANYNFPEEHSRFLQNPTRTEIIRAFEELAAKITPRDNLLIFYAGHGYWNERLKIGYWLPADAKADDRSDWIPNSVIRDYIGGIQSKHTLLITDACFSGSIFKTRDVTLEMEIHAFTKKYRLPSRKAMTSGTLTTVPDESKFIEYLVNRLTENTSEFLSATQLFYSLETAILNNTSTVPQFGVMQDTGDEGGDFIFIRK